MKRLQTSMKEKALEYKYSVPAVAIEGKHIPNIYIYEEKAAYLTYSSFKLNICKTLEEIDQQILDIIDFFGKKMSQPRTNVLSIEEISQLLGIVQRKFNLLDLVTWEKELEIYLLNRSHLCYDSFLLTFKDTSTGTLLNKWMLFSLSPCTNLLACNKYFVFFHELGHILYHTVTREGKKAPAMFDELSLVLGRPAAEDENGWNEFFADTFAAAAINNTNYSEYNPFKQVLSHEIFELLDLYFQMLIFRTRRDQYGMESWKAVLH